jgi:hypothetical protein
MLLEKCPHCNVAHVQTQSLWGDYFHASKKTTSDKRWQVERCQNPACQRLVLFLFRDHENIESIYPVGSYDLDASININDEIKNDYREAGLCLFAGCYKASMVMSRRALQRLLKEQGCTKHNLADAIQEAIKSGVLRKAFHDIATEIREYGNLSAHPDDDQLSNANKEKAETILNFSRLLIEEFYEIPAAAQKLRKDRQPPSSITP